MHSFLRHNQSELIARCQEKVASRFERAATFEQLKYGVPLFLAQLVETLEIEQTDRPLDSRKISGHSTGGGPRFEMGISAAHHGRQLCELGFTVDQVVHDYGDLCQSITDLAFERDAPITVDEFRTLNRCLDNAVAEAVAEFSFQREAALLSKRYAEENERAGVFAHELRNHLGTLALAFTAAKTGNLSLSGATGAVLERSIRSLSNLIDQSLTDIRGHSQTALTMEQFSVADFVGELQAAAELSSGSSLKNCSFIVTPVDSGLAVEANRELLLAAVGNLLQNAFKFTKPDTEVTLEVYASADQILFDVKDHCGGLPNGATDDMFVAFRQLSDDRSGLGLGLSIARRSVELCGGTIKVRDLPCEGCVFTISLPRRTLNTVSVAN